MIHLRSSTRRRPLFTRTHSDGPQACTDTLVLATCLWFVATGNGSFWRALLDGRAGTAPDTWGLVAAVAVTLTALHFAFMAPLANRWTVRPWLSLLIVVAAFSDYYMDRFTVYLDPSMMRNVLRTNVAEARELFAWAMLPHLLWHAVLPLWLLWRVQPIRRPWLTSLPRRLGAWLLVLLLGAAALWSVFQDAAATMRNHKEMRWLITPGNVVWSVAMVLGQDSAQATRPRTVVGADAARTAPALAKGRKPMRVVLVVGETARAANWGLNGYARQTTPQLAAMPDVLAFTKASSCGTNTEVSVPCMFSPWGRRQYDEARIRGSQSLLHVLHRAGVQVFWRDNQSGCKGVCEGLPNETLGPSTSKQLCQGEHCLDEALLLGLDAILDRQPAGDQLLVLHQLGNHGPAYDKRYPEAFRRFTPVCETSDLRLCSQEQIVNAYDNALLYTDHVLAQTIGWLRQAEARYDTALIYLSDHGESLGERGLYLHGVPQAIAPDVQTQVPMVLWLSEGLARQGHIDLACLRQRAAQAASHDNLFHSVLGLMSVGTSLYEPTLDVFAGCRR
ncbi:MAG: phosphoethanolamine transferase [Ideonella sp.]|nr:phosphoethanolamine transferase [Ideonella sp.]